MIGGSAPGIVVVNAEELRGLGGDSDNAALRVQAVVATVESIIGRLDRSGWPVHSTEAERAWRELRSLLLRLSGGLADQRLELSRRADLVDQLDYRVAFGITPDEVDRPTEPTHVPSPTPIVVPTTVVPLLAVPAAWAGTIAQQVDAIPRPSPEEFPKTNAAQVGTLGVSVASGIAASVTAEARLGDVLSTPPSVPAAAPGAVEHVGSAGPVLTDVVSTTAAAEPKLADVAAVGAVVGSVLAGSAIGGAPVASRAGVGGASGPGYPLVQEAEYLEDGRRIRVRRWRDPDSEFEWDTFENLGPADAAELRRAHDIWAAIETIQARTGTDDLTNIELVTVLSLAYVASGWFPTNRGQGKAPRRGLFGSSSDSAPDLSDEDALDAGKSAEYWLPRIRDAMSQADLKYPQGSDAWLREVYANSGMDPGSGPDSFQADMFVQAYKDMDHLVPTAAAAVGSAAHPANAPASLTDVLAASREDIVAPTLSDALAARPQVQPTLTDALASPTTLTPAPAVQVPVAPAAQAPPYAPASVSGSFHVPNQISDAEYAPQYRGYKLTTCGLVSFVALESWAGNDYSLNDVIPMARQAGVWDPNLGMHGPAATQALLNQNGLATDLVYGRQDARIVDAVQSGRPVAISTAAHYYVIAPNSYDPSSNTFEVGTTGTILGNYGGRARMTLDAMDAASRRLAGAGFQAAIIPTLNSA